MHQCRLCGGDITPIERVTQLGKDTCMRAECVSVVKHEKFGNGQWTVVLNPKGGFIPMPADHPLIATMGKSSGRS